MKKILISGSLAYDYIMSFPGQFKDHILPDKIHILNVGFLIDSFNKNFGGTAGNIAYTTGKIGGEPLLFAPVGNDGDSYRNYFKQIQIDDKYIFTENIPTAAAHIITDKDDNQITAFYPGASANAKNHSLKDVEEKIGLVIIAPNNVEAMIRYSKESRELGIQYVFDPGQQITALSEEDLKKLIKEASFIISNDYEMELIQKRTGWTIKDILEFPYVKAVITTLGANGSRVTTKDEEIEVPGVETNKLIDPTGAGDAYRAGFFTAYISGSSYRECAQTGNVAALFAIEYHGTQNPELTKENFQKRYQENYETNINF